MTNGCSDNACNKKVRAIDSAIGYDSTSWSVILEKTDDMKDVENALRFCEVFHLEAKVRVTSEGYRVLIRDELIRLL
ncbi:MAG: hypothetical protein EAX95_04425 [Candidatus Thorarchaeota archaeon]|nr:hypothetical protein [Candidatus Thorarchaeota archaeon]